MLDIQFIRENKDLVQTAAKNKNVDVDIDKLLKLDEQRRSLSAKADNLRHEKNELSASVSPSPSAEDTENKTLLPSADDIATAKNLKGELGPLEDQLEKVEAEYKELLYKVPNIPSDDTPVGKDESSNKVLRKCGEPPKFAFKPKAHWQLGKELDLIDSDRAAKVSGSRFTFLKGRLVHLQFALIQWVIDSLTDEAKLADIIKQSDLKVIVKPFVLVIPPAMIRGPVFERTGRLDPAEDKYHIKDDNLYMVGSAEHTLVAMHADEVIAADQLPLRYLGYSTNFRREAGSYGKDVRGILRQHQFDKLEMEVISTAEDSFEEHKLLGAIQEYLLAQLGIAYRVVHISTGDMGKPDAQQIDLEAWMPGQNAYKETHTNDHMTDFQARRLNIKYKDKAANAIAHTNDGTAIALGRTLIAIMENYQTKEGKIKIPEALKDYIKGSYL